MSAPSYFPAGGCCWCCVAMVERGDMIGHDSPTCPFPPCDYCGEPVAELFTAPDGLQAVRVLRDLAYLPRLCRVSAVTASRGPTSAGGWA